MQNRSMFPFRRHGAKKRSKGPGRKSRGPQRPLPNSARDLLPMLQPATKALAQVLAGRAGASGQLNHARNLLAHAERSRLEGKADPERWRAAAEAMERLEQPFDAACARFRQAEAQLAAHMPRHQTEHVLNNGRWPRHPGCPKRTTSRPCHPS